MNTASQIKWLAENRRNPLDESPVLYDAALGEFCSKSFKDASLNGILQAAGLNKGSFYYRFYDKLDLYLSMLYKIGLEKLAFFETVPEKADFFESIRQKVSLGLSFAKKEPRYYLLWRRVLSEDSSVRERVRISFGATTQNMAEKMILKAIAEGQLRSDVSPKLLSAVFSLLLESLDLIIDPQEENELTDRADELIKIIKTGMRA